MDPITATVIVGVASALLSGIVGVIISNRHYRTYEKHKMKVDTLKRLSANRFDVTGDEFSRAINEIYVVFQDSPKVLEALKDYHRALRQPDSLDYLVRLFKAMSRDVNINVDRFDDSFFLTPFNARPSSTALPTDTPPRELPSGNPRLLFSITARHNSLQPTPRKQASHVCLCKSGRMLFARRGLIRALGLPRCRISWYDSLEVIRMIFTVEFEREDDGRWLAEVPELPGVLAYGQSSDETIAKAQALGLRVLADRLEHSEGALEFLNISFAAA